MVPTDDGVMRRDAPVEYDSDFWIRHMLVGVGLSAAIISSAVLYLLLTPQGPHRRMLLLAFATILTCSVLLLRVPWRRLLQGRRGLVLFYVWSATLLACITLIAYFDGGLASPFVFTYVLPMIFAAMAYPPIGMAGVTMGCVLCIIVLGAVSGGEPGPVFMVCAMQICAGGMGGLINLNHRRSHDRQVALQGELEHLASVDGLTGCRNHRTFHEVLGQEVAVARRTGVPLALAALDLDKFKEINDTHGHPVGDEVLAAIGLLLRGIVGRADLVARTGGEEFAVLMPATDLAGALDLAERLRDAVGRSPHPVAVTASIGISVLPDLASDGHVLVQQADQSLYHAKRRGRDRVVAFALDAPAPPGNPTRV